jgi:CheY-like chemotaxis protein
MPRILVIEDDRIQRTVTAHALKGADHEVMEASDGREGLELSRTQRPDLIVCDVVMPGLNGYQFVAALRAEEGIADIPVIMLTAMSERAQVRTGMNMGADDYLAKPFNFAELNDAVAALLAKRRALQEGLVNSMNTSFQAALEEQRESLADQYEKRYVRELSARWESGGDANPELQYEDVVVIKVDIFGSMFTRIATRTDGGQTVRRAYQSARDSLHLFTPLHLLPAGNHLLTVFADEPDSVRVAANVRAVRASFAVLKALAAVFPEEWVQAGGGASGTTMALHRGPVTLLRLSDPLHGDPDSILATGATIATLDAMVKFARASNWQVIGSDAFTAQMGGQLVTGAEEKIVPADPSKPPLDVVQIRALR